MGERHESQAEQPVNAAGSLSTGLLEKVMTEEKILAAFRRSLKAGDRVRHKADWIAGTVVGKIHVMYETGVRFDDRPQEESPVYLANLFPEWWPAPDWVKELAR